MTIPTLNLTPMNLKVVFTRNGEQASLEMFAPIPQAQVWCIWWCHTTNDQRVVKLSKTEARATRWFEKRVSKLQRCGWEVKE
jgi:hypothetical protein